jgi:hypothetical protein
MLISNNELKLTWSGDRNIYLYVDAEVLEGLQPRPNLKSLDINYYGGSKSPSWLQVQFLTYLNKLCNKDCANRAEARFWSGVIGL